MQHELILIVDFGGQYKQLIARRVREAGVYCEVISYKSLEEVIATQRPAGIIFTGGPNSVTDEDAPLIDPAILEMDIPVLGICYGAQLMVHLKKGSVAKADKREYGKQAMELVNPESLLLQKIPASSTTWMSHTFYIDELTQSFSISAKTTHCPVAAFENKESKLYGVQFHPEVAHTEYGETLIQNFLFTVCACKADWQMASFVEEQLTAIRELVGDRKVEAKKLGEVDFLLQGTIYPDVIESGAGHAAVIKSHHNVGGLPENIMFKHLLEPLRDLFKDEVRALGRELGMPSALVDRQPFPGPGLAIRIIGEITKEKLDILKEADFIYRDEISKAGWDTKIWQYFAVLTNMRTVGVMGDERTYHYTIALRGVTSTDGMTADWARIPHELLAMISNRIVNEVDQVNRVVYDISSKPPATIEWE
ncbi:UNVERIFIED_CONTAM: hypothetical protein GTU68_006736 [Idotea baltica]|nr:hypothetical protein [Idotea baltica]